MSTTATTAAASKGRTRSPIKRTLGFALALTATLTMSACAETNAGVMSLQQAQVENRTGAVSEEYPPRPVVLEDENGTATSRMFFRSSRTVVVAGPGAAAQLRAASVAVFAHAPMLSYTRETHDEVAEEVARLDSSIVLTVGNVGFARTVGDVTVIEDPGTAQALGDLTAHEFDEAILEEPSQMVNAIAELDGQSPVLLRPDWDVLTRRAEEVPAFPVQSRRDGQLAPLVVATAESPLAAVATARSFGAEVRVMPDPNPAANRESLLAVTGLSSSPLVALGEQFGSGATLAAAIEEAESAATARE